MSRKKEKNYVPKIFSLDVRTVAKLEELVKDGFGRSATEVVEKAIERVYKERLSKNLVVIDLENEKELLTALNFYQGMYLKEFGEYIPLSDLLVKLLKRLLLLEIIGVEREMTIETINFFRKTFGLSPIKDVKIIEEGQS